MKHIKSINEYNRTIGFRYSKPRESFHVTLFFAGKLDENSIESVLNNIDVTYESINIRKKSVNDVEIAEHIDGVAEFDIFIYNEKELRSIFENILKIFENEFNVKIVDFITKENPKMSK
jgi:hypothetical protein